MKRMICLLLALICLVSLCACGGSAAPAADTAPAAEAEPEAAEEAAEEAEATPEPVAMPPYEPFETPFGFTAAFPEEYQHLKGELVWRVVPFGYQEATMELYYAEVPQDEREACREKVAVSQKNISSWTPEWMREYKYTSLFSLWALCDKEDRVEHYETITPLEYINQFYGGLSPESSGANVPVFLQTVPLENGWKIVTQRIQFFTREGEEAPLESTLWRLDDEYKQEALTLLENPDLFVSVVKEAPWELPGQVGSRVSFETQTLQGDTVTSEELLAGHKVTMVNVWATWCPPCIAELPEREKLNADFAAKDCQIIGICVDASHGDPLDEALQYLGDAGVTYPNLKANLDMIWVSNDTMSTTFFLSEDGTILTEPVIGVNMYAYNNTRGKARAKVG